MLYQKDIISKTDFENIQLEYDIAEHKITQWKRDYYHKWQGALVDYRNNLLELQSSQKQLTKSETQ